MKTQTDHNAGGGCPAAPLARSYTHEEALNVAKQWMRDNYGIARELSEEARDRYHEKLGLLVDFLWTLHPPESSPNADVEARRK
jgi:hypothetical protein